jgi:hypothetical protein
MPMAIIFINPDSNGYVNSVFDPIHDHERVGVVGVLVHRHRHTAGQLTEHFDLEERPDRTPIVSSVMPARANT